MSAHSWGVDYINAPSFWSHSRGAEQVVAVLDTGIDDSHSILRGRVIHATGDYVDDIGHGTHVAGIIATVAPECRILNVKTNAVGGLIQAIRFATNWRGANGERVSVMNISQSVDYDNVGLEMAICDAVTSEILVVCAAGNQGDGDINTNEIKFPAAYPEVIQVGAIDQKGNLADFSNTNNEVDYVAPGVDIWSCGRFGSWAMMSGTSQATPFIAGAALLVKAYVEEKLGRVLSVSELRGYLRQLAKEIGCLYPTLDLSLPLHLEFD